MPSHQFLQVPRECSHDASASPYWRPSVAGVQWLLEGTREHEQDRLCKTPGRDGRAPYRSSRRALGGGACGNAGRAARELSSRGNAGICLRGHTASHRRGADDLAAVYRRDDDRGVGIARRREGAGDRYWVRLRRGDICQELRKTYTPSSASVSSRRSRLRRWQSSVTAMCMYCTAMERSAGPTTLPTMRSWSRPADHRSRNL